MTLRAHRHEEWHEARHDVRTIQLDTPHLVVMVNLAR